ncbi:unnamed protein product [marine sediment metagenome]|uniref:Uncharacterized protein n=1 Tax=marine sediment metagenome TaxID=412755 RepID=X1BBG2_9ZZZZ
MSETQIADNKIPKVRWRHRRRMAWTALIYFIIKTLLLLFFVDVEKIKVLTEPLAWSYFSAAAIVGTYMGAATFEYIKKS